MINSDSISPKKTSLIIVIALLVLSPFADNIRYSSSQTPAANWTYSGFDQQNTNFDPQTVINFSNVNQLQLSWIYQVPENPFSIPGTAKSLGIETTPLVVNGIIYFATPYNDVIALNANTGTTLW